MKVEYNGIEYEVNKGNTGRVVEAYILNGDVFSDIPKGAKEIGTIHTVDGVFSILKKNWSQFPNVFICIAGVVALVALYIFIVRPLVIPIAVKYNPQMTQTDGYVDINVLTDSRDVYVQIITDEFTTVPVLVPKESSLQSIYIGNDHIDAELTGSVIFTVGKREYSYPAKIKIKSNGDMKEAPADEEAVESEEPEQPEVSEGAESPIPSAVGNDVIIE